MLVLCRKNGENVVIAGNVVVTVLAVQGNRVKLGITAPADVAIRRAELAEVHGNSPPLQCKAIVHRNRIEGQKDVDGSLLATG